MAEIRIMISYCIKGHEIEYRAGGIARSRCPICGSPVDRSRPPISLEEAQKIKEEQAAREAELQAAQEAERRAAEAVPEPAEQPEIRPAEGIGGQPEQQTGRSSGVLPGQPANRSAGVLPGQPANRSAGVLPGQPANRSAGVLPGQPANRSTGVLPGQPANRSTGVLPGQPANRNTGVLPGQPGIHRPGGPGMAQPAGIQRPSGSTFFLNLYGDRIPIPEEGAWIGREGLGSRWFDGNLMISRKHVYVRPNPQTGRLQVNEDKSLNGAFYSGPGGERIRIDGARMMQPGEILWIYNIPLKIEY